MSKRKLSAETRPRNAFRLFVDEIKEQFGSEISQLDLAKVSLKGWSGLSREAKNLYKDRATAERERYVDEWRLQRAAEIEEERKKAKGYSETSTSSINKGLDRERKHTKTYDSGIPLGWETAIRRKSEELIIV